MRLNKFLSLTLGLGRRASDDLIAAKKVRINDEVASLGNQVDPDKDEVKYFGKVLTLGEMEHKYILLNKPVGYLSSKVSQEGAPTVYELLPTKYKKLNLNIAGRLDKDSSGLIMLTNDGEFLNNLVHPSNNKVKKYIVGLKKDVSEGDLEKLKSGVDIGDSRSSRFKNVQVLAPNKLVVELTEGRNRQIRRTFFELGYKVNHLQRTAIGPYKLADLKEGQTLEVAKL